MSRHVAGSAAVGADDFLARYAPNLSLKERGSLTSMVRVAVRDYMEENRLAQPPPPRVLAYMMQRRPASSAGRARTPLLHRRPRTARGFAEEEAEAGDGIGEDFCLVGSSTGIPTDTPRYAMVSPKFAPPPAVGSGPRHRFSDSLMGFGASPEARQGDATGSAETGKQQQQQQQQQQPQTTEQPTSSAVVEKSLAKRPATAAGAAAGSNWLTWRGATPFCASDRELRAFRHRQNSKKPMPEEPPPCALHSNGSGQGAPRPLTARGTSGAKDSERTPIDRSILDWVHSATDQDKQVAYNLIKAIGSSRGADGLETFRHQMEVAAAAPRPEGRAFGRRRRPLTPHRMSEAEAERAALFRGVEENFANARRWVSNHNSRPPFDYVHPGSGFQNAVPPYMSNFVVHPDWISELAAPAPPPRARRRAAAQPATE